MSDISDLETKIVDGDRLRARVRRLVEDSDCEALSKIFNADSIDSLVVEHAWDLIPTLCDGLTLRNESERSDLVDVCYSAIKILAERGNAKEVVIALLEQADTFLPDFKWQGLLEPIQIALLRLPSKRQHSLNTTLETLYAHLELIEIPEYDDRDEERKLLAVDTNVNRLLENVRLYIDFLQPFVLEVPDDQPLNSNQCQQRDYLLIAVFRILSKKLLYLYYDPVNDNKPAVWFMADKLMSYIGHLCRDFYGTPELVLDLLCKCDETENENGKPEPGKSETEDKDSDSDEFEKKAPATETCDSLPHISVAMFQYLLHVEGMSADRLASVFTPNHLFQICLPSVALMFSSPRPVIVDKGCQLALKLLDYKPMTRFTNEFTYLQEFCAFTDNLLQAVVMCQSKEVRMKCVRIFPSLLEKFDSGGKHMIFLYCFHHTGHSGVKGHLLQLVKEELVRSFNKTSDYMTPVRVLQVVELLFVLPEGAVTDLLDHSDVIIACLNFLRYLVIRDKENESGVWNLIKKLEKEFLEPLYEGLNYSRGHYEQELMHCLAGKSATEDLLKTGIDYKLKVGKQDVNVDIPPEQAQSILQGALHNFDLMQSLLSRVEELIRINKKSVTNRN